ncbi:hypothetical protein GYMLUDRAFT_64975 [Collybiopsis luxurians FD-317 M1]|uniref:Uncharacterized protein n=1 Tax=Collybiopsis luxurians FD-317 M1 TaxID=944289 RepID=A0A0D0BA42_9AGAR|nr:hypothetical protein GYMLUDRAFT_64975 [Collybiopsis luxurians FD-317 M1]
METSYEYFNPSYRPFEEDKAFYIEPCSPPQETAPRSLSQIIDYDVSIPASAENHRSLEMSLQAQIHPDFSGESLDVRTWWSRSTPDNNYIDYSVPAPWSLSTNSQFVSIGGLDPSRNTYSLQPDSNSIHLASLLPLDSVADPGPWPAWLENPLESRAGVAQSASLLRGSQMNFYGFTESLRGGGTMDTNCQYPTELHSAISYDDYGLSEHSISPLAVSPTDDYVQPRAPRVIPTDPAQHEVRSVSSPAIVRAARMRRKVDPESGVVKPPRFRCSEDRCIELGVGFTSKQKLQGPCSMTLALH